MFEDEKKGDENGIKSSSIVSEMIPKPILIYKCDCYHQGKEIPFATNYVKPENIHYWIGDYEADKLLISKVWVMPKRHEVLFS